MKWHRKKEMPGQLVNSIPTAISILYTMARCFNHLPGITGGYGFMTALAKPLIGAKRRFSKLPCCPELPGQQNGLGMKETSFKRTKTFMVMTPCLCSENSFQQQKK